MMELNYFLFLIISERKFLQHFTKVFEIKKKKLQLKDENQMLALFSHFICFMSCSKYLGLSYHHVFLSIYYSVLNAFAKV